MPENLNYQDQLPDAEVLKRVLEALGSADAGARQRILQAVAVFYGLDLPQREHASSGKQAVALQNTPEVSTFSEDRSVSPKEFMLEKRPQTDVDRVVCLAYYLAHYRGVENFKTLDISKLNTEAAQLKLSNPAQATDNAAKAGFIIPSQKGHKKISAIGEIYVQALPDKVAAREAVLHARPKKKKT